MTEKITYTFDTVAIVTVKVSTVRNTEAAARTAADGLLSMEVSAMITDLETSRDVPDGTRYELTCVSPRRPAYLVYACNENSREVACNSDGGFWEPLADGGRYRAEAERLVRWARREMDPDEGSNDGEHEALRQATELLAAVFSISE